MKRIKRVAGKNPQILDSYSFWGCRNHRALVHSLAGEVVETTADTMHCDLNDWFLSDSLPHQPALTRYLKRMCGRKRTDPIDRKSAAGDLPFSIDELTPERRMQAGQELQCLTRAFDALPQRTQPIIWMRRVEGLSQRKAAESLGIDESALMGHMSHGLRRLETAMLQKNSKVE